MKTKRLSSPSPFPLLIVTGFLFLLLVLPGCAARGGKMPVPQTFNDHALLVVVQVQNAVDTLEFLTRSDAISADKAVEYLIKIEGLKKEIEKAKGVQLAYVEAGEIGDSQSALSDLLKLRRVVDLLLADLDKQKMTVEGR